MNDGSYPQTALPFGDRVDPNGFAVAEGPTPSQLVSITEEAERLQRQADSESISARFAEKLAERSPQRTMSPDYVAAQPLSLKAKLKVTPEEEEIILFHYASTSSVPQTISLSGIRVDKVRSVVYAPDLQDRLSELRSAMRVSVIRKIEETQAILLDALQDPTKLNNSSLTQISDVFREISETQMHLLEASRSPSHFVNEVDPATVFTGDELEYMAFLRRRLATPGDPPTALPLGESGGSIGDSPPHELDSTALEAEFGISPSASSTELENESPFVKESKAKLPEEAKFFEDVMKP